MPCRITVPEPCQEDWTQMKPAANGRHCDACNKIVVDFTGWSVEKIAGWFRRNQEEKVCGRFETRQLNVTIPYSAAQWVQQVSNAALTLTQRIALIFLLAFGLLISSCGTNDPEESAATGNIVGALELPDVSLIPPRVHTEEMQKDTAQALKLHSNIKKKTGRSKPAAQALQEPVLIQEVTMGVPELEVYPADTAR